MIVTNTFENDCNERLKLVQHDDYGRNVVKIFKAARSELIHANAILESHLLIVKKAKEVSSINHRALQDAHDILAAAFRYQWDDGGQLALFEKHDSQSSRYSFEWTSWLERQLQDLVRYPQLVRSVVQSVVFTNTEMGYMAEGQVCAFLLSYFNAEDWMFEDGYLETYKKAATP